MYSSDRHSSHRLDLRLGCALVFLLAQTAFVAYGFGDVCKPIEAGPKKDRAERALDDSPPFVADDPKLTKMMEESARKISVYEAGVIHIRLQKAFKEAISVEVYLCSASPLNSVPVRTNDQIGGSLIFGRGQELIEEEKDLVTRSMRWSLVKDGVVFSFWISTMRTRFSVGSFSVSGKKRFVNVDYVSNGRSVDDKLPELGGTSIRKLLCVVSQKLNAARVMR